MAKNLQIRNVPDDVHAVVRARAAEAGLSLSDYLLREITAFARRPTAREVFERLARRSHEHGPTVDDIVSAIHDGRDE